ncbi:FAD-dependent oxidoreductase [Nocardia terpenica]|uniref:FAD-dependent oxidoreductase n=1 Tax=Nocardia terpenica TaxID=455432 RepID=UPI0009EF574D|nr:NAD(P)/FAD-dependent oxidoreductase [Nocardia terpenica]
MVTIIGGGIAGSALAGAFARRGKEDVRLYEQQTDVTAGGAFLVVDGRGHAALTALGVDEDRLHDASYPLNGLRSISSAGDRIEATPDQIRERGHRFWQRRRLMAILAEHVADSGVDTHYGAPVTDITLGVTDGCLLHHGTTTTAVTDDLIIAADGIDSVVRARLEPARTPVYAGEVMLYGMTTGPVELPTDPSTLHFYREVDSQLCTFGHIWRPDEPAAWFMRFTRPAADPTDLGVRPIDEWAETVLAGTPHNQNLARILVENTSQVYLANARNVPLTGAAEPELPVLLVGDADHAITPAAGVGARDALEDVHAVYQAHISGESPAAAMARRRAQLIDSRNMAVAQGVTSGTGGRDGGRAE